MALHRAVVGQHDVVHAVVAVHHRGALLRRDAPGQLVAHPLDQAAVVDPLDLHLVVLRAPPLELALDVPVVPGQVAQPHRVGVDGMQRGERVGHVVAHGAPGRLVEGLLGLGRAAQDVPLDELHDIEGALVDRLVGAQPDGPRHRDADRAERIDEPVLAGHVVRGGQHVVQRGPAQRPGPPVAVLHPESQVGAAAGDEGEGERRRQLGHVVGEPLRDLGLVDPLLRIRHRYDANRWAAGLRLTARRPWRAGPIGRPEPVAPPQLPGPRVLSQSAADGAAASPPGRYAGAAISVVSMDVTDQTFQDAVLARSTTVPVVVDLWAPWCGPCKTLGPMLERAVAATEGAVELAKVNVDDNPRVAQSFQVQSIPAVFAISNGQVVDQFIGALPEDQVIEFVQRLAPAPSEADLLVDKGDEASLRQALELEPDHAAATEALARVLIDRGDAAAALAALGRLPETETGRALAAEARLLEAGVDVSSDGIAAKLDELLERVRE